MTTIILNAEGINALFPEGSEARVQLQSTVLRQLAEQFIKEAQGVDKMRVEMQSLIKEVQEDARRQMGIRRTAWGQSALTEELQKKFAEAARASVDQGIHDAIKGKVDTAMSAVDAEIERQVNKQVAAKVRDELARFMSAASYIGGQLEIKP